MTSNSSLGSTNITLQFDLDRNIDAAAQDVQAAGSMPPAAGFPNNLPSPPFMRKVNPADSSVLVLAMTSDTVPLNIVSDYADNIVGQQLARMKGVGEVNFGGSRKPADPHPDRSAQGGGARPAARSDPRNASPLRR